MTANRLWHRKLGTIVKTGLLLLVGASMSACAATSWKEEVLLHDGSKIIVERSQIREGRHHIGQGPPIKEQTNTFTPPGWNKAITWKSEFTPDIGHANFDLLALDVLHGTPYIAAQPTRCQSYNKWGRPNPPYVFFKYANQQWTQISLAEFPEEIRRPNVLINTWGHDDVDQAVRSGFVSHDLLSAGRPTHLAAIWRAVLSEPTDRDLCWRPSVVRFRSPTVS